MIVLAGTASGYGIEISGTCTTADLILQDGGLINDGATPTGGSGDALAITQDMIQLTGQVEIGYTDWGAAGAGAIQLVEASGWDWAFQANACLGVDVTGTAVAAAYHSNTITVTQTGSTSAFGTWTELYFSDSVDFSAADNAAAVWAQVEVGDDVSVPATSGDFLAGVYANVKSGETFTTGANSVVNGVRVKGDIDTTTISHSGRLAAFECLIGSSTQPWDYGLYINGATYGVHVPAAAATTHAILIGDEDAEMPVANTKDYQLGVFAKVGTETSSKVLSAARFLMNSDDTISRGSTYNALYATNYYEGASKTTGGASVHDVLWAELWGAGTVAWAIGPNVWMDAIRANVEFPEVTAADSDSHVFGVRISSDVHSGATMSGDFAALYIDKQAGHLDWTTGIDVNNATTAIDIAGCTTGISFTGTTDTAIDFSSMTASTNTDGVLMKCGTSKTVPGITLGTNAQTAMELYVSATPTSGRVQGLYLDLVGNSASGGCDLEAGRFNIYVTDALYAGNCRAVRATCRNDGGTIAGHAQAGHFKVASQRGEDGTANNSVFSGNVCALGIFGQVSSNDTIGTSMYSAIRFDCNASAEGASHKAWDSIFFIQTGGMNSVIEHFFETQDSYATLIAADKYVAAGTPDDALGSAAGCIRISLGETDYFVPFFDSVT